MMRKTFLIPILAMLGSCGQHPPSHTGADTATHADTQQHAATTPVAAASHQDDEEEEDLQSIYNDYIATYTRPCRIDSSFTLGADRYVLHTAHVCLMDSGLVIPKTYAAIYKLDSFVTHNFVTRLRLEKNGAPILDTTIRKENFGKVIFPEERQYAVLFCPYLDLKNGDIRLHYSISIPLTDVGVGAYVAIGTDGSMAFTDDH